MKKIILISFIFNAILLNAIDGFFLGFKGGVLIKVDVASAFSQKRIIDPDKKIENSIKTGIGEYGATSPHGFPRVLEALAAPYADLSIVWGYKFPKLFSLGFGILLSNFVMSSLEIDFKFSFLEEKKIKPFVFGAVVSGLLDGFPFQFIAGGGFDYYFDEHFYMLFESRLGAELFVSKYYDDGNNSNPIWHWDSLYAYSLFAIYIGIGYQFKNPYTDKDGKWIGKSKK